MSTVLSQANYQWRNRPDDERFESLEAMHASALDQFEHVKTAEVTLSGLSVEQTSDADLVLVGPAGLPLGFTNYSFGQLARAVGTSAEFLAQEQPDVVSTILNRRLARHSNKMNALMYRCGAANNLRAINGTAYQRIWNKTIIEFLRWLRDKDPNWRLPPARPVREGQAGTRKATEADVLDAHGSIQVGDLIAPAGAYKSDHDLFVFMVNQARTLELNQGKEILGRGFFFRNSEVGDGSFWITMFRYGFVCGNHYVWDAQDIEEIRFRHVGKDLPERVRDAMNRVKVLTDVSVTEDSIKLEKLRSFLFGSGKESVVKQVRQLVPTLSQITANAAYDAALQFADIHGDPNTAWGYVGGLTRVSQLRGGYADKRTELDRIGGYLLQIASA